MRIAMCITSYHPIVGGAERQLAQIARRMIAQGHEVLVVTRHHAGLDLEETVNGVPVRRVAARGPKPARAAMFVAGAARALAAFRPDVIHCHGLFSPTTAGLLAATSLGVPLVSKPMRGGETRIVARNAIGKLRLKFFARRVTSFVAVSREIEREIAGIGVPDRKIRFIPNGVDTDLYRQSAKPAEDGLRIAFAGRMTAQKAVPVLADAWRRVIAAEPGACLLVAEAKRIGEAGAEEVAIRTELAGLAGCTMLGHVEDMPAFLAGADAFVLPSASEGLSNAMLEAGAAGLGIVATAVGGAPDVIVDGRNGLLVPPDDPDALAGALLSLVRDPEKCARFGAAMRETIVGRYSIDATVRGLLDLYAKLGPTEFG